MMGPYIVFFGPTNNQGPHMHFSDFFVFDFTYKVYKFRIAFAPFICMNHHLRSSLFGGALLEDETTNTFVWLYLVLEIHV